MTGAAMLTTPPSAAPVTEPSLVDLLLALWRAKLYLLAGALLGALLAFIWLATAVPHYRAELLTGPAERPVHGPDIKALLPDNSSFAVQYLVNTLARSDSADFARFENILRAPAVAAQLYNDETILHGIAQDRRFGFQPDREIPDSPAALSAYLQKQVMIAPVGHAPLRRLVYSHPDRAFSTYLLTALTETADGLIRQDIRDRTEARAAYLRQTMAGTNHPDHRRALTALLMEQEHIRMLLAMDEPFAAMIAEPAFAAVRPVWPHRAIILTALPLIGALLGFALFGLRRSFAQHGPEHGRAD